MRGVILFGKSLFRTDEKAPKPDLTAIKGRLPLLGVCYGAQYLWLISTAAIKSNPQEQNPAKNKASNFWKIGSIRMENLQTNLTLIQQRLAAASDGKYPVPKLIAVTKTHPAEDILPLQNLGVTDIGENKVQEIMEKLPALEKNFRIHLIGRLQSNKVKYIIDHVCLIHSVDRLSLAQEIDRQAQKHNRVMPVLIQVSPLRRGAEGRIAP